ncbi:regulator of chromosome condensation 1/beta-lactamase-inhibitor protein II [Cercophora newfieldiana]|uniref:Regulator of chromosome condensation 1/beta-lactamase-inhibitor protein II n=1 Tax=Cercophora newfieldiana TaxID=92897 RepID=A0AA39XSC3_9PEZI|nr:regulator of chromosome condensation 1/beta-lactamase-inhibitor protein II [Cercophora newfieldiana]
MELYAAGFNAWGQLQFGKDEQTNEEPDDIPTFTRVLRDDNGIDGIHPFPSYTIVHTKTSGVLTAGLIPKADLPLTTLPHPSYSHFARASNGLSVFNDTHLPLSPLFPQPPWTPLSSLFPANTNIPSTVTQLISYTTGFAALSTFPDGSTQVYTWGDERYAACLGRDIPASSDTNGAADSQGETEVEVVATTPGIVTDLSDLPTGPITKLAAGGYVLAALTAGKDLYIWGHGGRAAAAGLRGLGVSGETMPIVIEDYDIEDVAVGEGHVVVLTTSGEVFVIGSNSNGQLGLGQEVKGVESWTRVSIKSEGDIVGVAAGPKCSFLLVRDTVDKK